MVDIAKAFEILRWVFLFNCLYCLKSLFDILDGSRLVSAYQTLLLPTMAWFKGSLKKNGI